jgi:3-phenylpropionate/trans-cinnamate dioxygenase ferredoxin component
VTTTLEIARPTRRNEVDFTRVGSIAEIPDGELRAFETPSGRVAVARSENRMFAFGDECTHHGCSLSEGELSDRDASVECPCHASIFDIETGEPVEGPAVDPVPVFPVRVVEDWVEVGSHPGGEA